MRRLGLDYEALASINPGLIYASISGFGQTGPYSQRPAFDAVMQAMSGMMSITGEENRPPPGSVSPSGTLEAACSARSAFWLPWPIGRSRDEEHDVAMLDAQIALLENAVARYLNTGERPRRLGSRHPLIAPFQAFPTKDEPIVICVDTEAQWKHFCDAIDRSDLIASPLFADGSARARHHAELEPELISALSQRTRAEWLSIFELVQVPAGPINDIATAVERRPQVLARGMIRRSGERAFVNQPVRFSTYPETPDDPAPALGEHASGAGRVRLFE